MTRPATKVDPRQQELAWAARMIETYGRIVTYVPEKGLGAVVEGVFTSVDDYARAYPADGSRPAKGKPATNEPADPEAKRRLAEALAYVRSYTGTWGLILDIRADPRMGTKYMKLSPRQVEVILQARDRDIQREEARAIDRELFAADQYQRHVEEAARAAQPAPDPQSRPTRPEEPGLAPQRPSGAPMGGPVTEGMYRLPDGTIAKVQRAVHGSHQLYAKRLVVGGDRGTFEYAPGLIRALRPEHRMTVDEAASFGQLYGWCCVCGRTLTDEKSIAAGIGPVCASKV